jgi:hypothetical protein
VAHAHTPHGSQNSSPTIPLGKYSAFLWATAVNLSYTECTTVRVGTLQEKREREDE